MAKKLKATQVVVLNTIQALAADLVLAGGKLTLNDGSVDLSTPVKLSDGTDFTATNYSAGVASVKEYDLTAVSLTAQSNYRMEVSLPIQANVAGNVTAEANELTNIREYVVWFDAAPTADELRDAFIDRINNDTSAKVTAASGGAGIVELTLDDVDDCDFTVVAPAGTVETVTTPYTEPAGTPAIVEELAPALVSQTATYRTYELSYEELSANGLISGGKVFFPKKLIVFADEGATNFAAFDTEITAIMDGTHTPVADYLGV